MSAAFGFVPSSLAQDRVAQKAIPPVSVAQGTDAKNSLSEIAISLATNSNEIAIASLISQYAADQKTLGQRFRIPLDNIGNEYRSSMLVSWEAKLNAID